MKDYNIYKIDKDEAGIVIKDYMRSKLMLSRRSLVTLKRSGKILLNGEAVHVNIRLKEGDTLEIQWGEETSENVMPECMDLNIIYEDEYLIILNKASGMPVHPTRNHVMGTMANGLAYHWMNEIKIKIRPVNRLDKNTSGLIIFAKNAHIQHLLSQKNGTDGFVKEYLAIVQGHIEPKKGLIDEPIAREKEDSLLRVVRADGERALTHYRVLEEYEDCSLVLIKLETGRTHQIRVHMSNMGHPLIGDDLYGGSTKLLTRQALHAFRITMEHPVTGSRMVFEAPLPQDMKDLLLQKEGVIAQHLNC